VKPTLIFIETYLRESFEKKIATITAMMMTMTVTVIRIKTITTI
jgi:hypothetical protein